MTRFTFETPERLEVGIHTAKVPKLAIVVVRAGDDTGSCRVNREGRHSLLLATGCVSVCRPPLSQAGTSPTLVWSFMTTSWVMGKAESSEPASSAPSLACTAVPCAADSSAADATVVDSTGPASNGSF